MAMDFLRSPSGSLWVPDQEGGPGMPPAFLGGVGLARIAAAGRSRARSASTSFLGTISDCQITAIGSGSLTVTWTDVAGATAYYSYYWDTTDSQWHLFGTAINPGTQTRQFTGLTNDQTYALLIVASDGTNVTYSNYPVGTPIASGTGPDFTEDFSTYTSNQDLHDDPRGIYTGDLWNTQDIFLDQTQGYNGRMQCQRYTFIDRTGNPAGYNDRCTDYMLGRDIVWGHTATEVWLRAVLKFPTDYTTSQSGFSCAGTNADHKLIFLLPSGVDPPSRWEFKIGTSVQNFAVGWQGSEGHQLNGEGDPGELAALDCRTFYNNAWTEIRFHAKPSTGPSSADGAIDVWVGATKIYALTGISTPNAGIRGMACGRNLNMGPDHDMSIYWGLLEVYFEGNDPGW